MNHPMLPSSDARLREIHESNEHVDHNEISWIQVEVSRFACACAEAKIFHKEAFLEILNPVPSPGDRLRFEEAKFIEQNVKPLLFQHVFQTTPQDYPEGPRSNWIMNLRVEGPPRCSYVSRSSEEVIARYITFRLRQASKEHYRQLTEMCDEEQREGVRRQAYPIQEAKRDAAKRICKAREENRGDFGRKWSKLAKYFQRFL